MKAFGQLIGGIIDHAITTGVFAGVTSYTWRSPDRGEQLRVVIHSSTRAGVKTIAEHLVSIGAHYVVDGVPQVRKSGMYVYAEAELELDQLELSVTSKDELATDFEAEMRAKGIPWKVAS